VGNEAQKNFSKANLEGKSVLFISYFYPPVVATNVPGAMRTIKFLRNFSNGVVHVLTAEKLLADSESALSHLSLPVNSETIHRVKSWDFFKLLLWIRDKIKGVLVEKNSNNCECKEKSKLPVFKSSVEDGESHTSFFQKLKDFIYNAIYFPDQAGPWIIPAVIKGWRVSKLTKFDVIFATGSPWSGLITGYLIGKIAKVPLILDFRDPWISNPFHLSKGNLFDKFSEYLEKKIVNSATLISLNTAPLKKDFIDRYPNVDESRFIVLPNGFDSCDFSGLEYDTEKSNSDLLTLCHAGFLYGVRDPAILLNSIWRANELLLGENKKICFKQIGDIQLSYDINERFKVMIGDGSLVLIPSKSYKNCLSDLKEADWLVNIQPGTKTQVPSKLYDYLALCKPILTITEKDGALGELISQYHFGELFDFDEEDKLVDRLIEIALHKIEVKQFKGYSEARFFDCKKISQSLCTEILRIAN
jgi:hypothetical protein